MPDKRYVDFGDELVECRVSLRVKSGITWKGRGSSVIKRRSHRETRTFYLRKLRSMWWCNNQVQFLQSLSVDEMTSSTLDVDVTVDECREHFNIGIPDILSHLDDLLWMGTHKFVPRLKTSLNSLLVILSYCFAMKTASYLELRNLFDTYWFYFCTWTKDVT